MFFEENYTGYRPVEYVISSKNGSKILETPTGYEIIENLTKQIQSEEAIANVSSVSTLINSFSSFLPVENVADKIVTDYQPVMNALLKNSPIALFNENGNKSRISAQIKDIGAYKIKEFTARIDQWLDENVDSTAFEVRYTGTGMIIDKNAVYVRESLLQGLLFALLVIGVLMGLLFKSIKMMFISLVPNTLPLLIAGAILGITGVPLEPLTSITFVVIFGIAVDDTIHFLSKYRLCLHAGMPLEKAIKTTFQETGKAIIFTTIVLFFGFMVMLFSYNPGSVIVGGLISITLFTALIADLVLLPVLLRYFKVY